MKMMKCTKQKSCNKKKLKNNSSSHAQKNIFSIHKVIMLTPLPSCAHDISGLKHSEKAYQKYYYPNLIPGKGLCHILHTRWQYHTIFKGIGYI